MPPKVDHFKLIFESDTLRPCDLMGKDVPVTIADVRETVVKNRAAPKQKPSNKWWLTFVGKTKGYAAGTTVCQQIAKVVGTPNPKLWAGKRIVLYATTCPAKGGEEVECIRVRPFPPRDAKDGAIQAAPTPQVVLETDRPQWTDSALDVAAPDAPIAPEMPE